MLLETLVSGPILEQAPFNGFAAAAVAFFIGKGLAQHCAAVHALAYLAKQKGRRVGGPKVGSEEGSGALPALDILYHLENL